MSANGASIRYSPPHGFTGKDHFTFTVDGKVFGFLIYSRMQGGGDVYLLADFVVNSTRYRRLAKLLLLVIQTREIRRMMEEKLLAELPKCTTMVFTDDLAPIEWMTNNLILQFILQGEVSSLQ